MTFTKIIAATLLPCALMAAPAFAQSSATKAEDYAKDKAVEEVKDTAKDMATEKANERVKTDNGMMIKGAPVPMEAPAPVIIAEDAEMSLEGDTTPYKSNELIAEPAMMDAPAQPTLVVIACPEGTTAQDDGTCMITGNYEE